MTGIERVVIKCLTCDREQELTTAKDSVHVCENGDRMTWDGTRLLRVVGSSLRTASVSVKFSPSGGER